MGNSRENRGVAYEIQLSTARAENVQNASTNVLE